MSGVLQQADSSVGSRPVNCPKISFTVILMPYLFRFGLYLFIDFKDEERMRVCSLSVLFLTLSLFLAASFTRVCQVWDPTQRTALSVSFIVTPVGVVLVACFF